VDEVEGPDEERSDLRPARLGPLWLPHGSVRALLALAVVFVTCWLTVLGEPVPVAVSEALFTGLAYYFASREVVRLSPAELARLRAERGRTEFDPLFLPHGTVRIIIVLAFLGLAGWIVHEQGWQRLLSATTLLLAFAFLLGQVVKCLVRWLRRKQARRPTMAIEHVKALAAVAIAAAFVALFVTDTHRTAPPQLHQAFLAFLIFYFGTR
jgi:Kef-type K+ transport system membrane component KefB